MQSENPPVDLGALRAYRFERVQRADFRRTAVRRRCSATPSISAMRRIRGIRRCGCCITRGDICLVPAHGRAVLSEYANNNCLIAPPPLPAIAEYRPARIHAFFDVAEHADEVSRLWAAEIADVVSTLMGPQAKRLAVDRCDLLGYGALEREGFALVEGQRILELARPGQTCGRDRVRASLAGGRGYRHGADAQDTAAGDHRESAVGRIALREYRERR